VVLRVVLEQERDVEDDAGHASVASGAELCAYPDPDGWVNPALEPAPLLGIGESASSEGRAVDRAARRERRGSVAFDQALAARGRLELLVRHPIGVQDQAVRPGQELRHERLARGDAAQDAEDGRVMDHVGRA
jgi:hypothetical protein